MIMRATFARRSIEQITTALGRGDDDEEEEEDGDNDVSISVDTTIAMLTITLSDERKLVGTLASSPLSTQRGTAKSPMKRPHH